MEMPIYSAVGDIITVMLCVICWLLLRSTYTMKQVNLKLFYIANSLICAAAVSHSFFHYLLKDINDFNVNYLYILHCIIYICLASVFVLYIVYLCNLFELSKKTTKKLYFIVFSAWIVFILYTIISSIFNFGFHIDENFQVHYDYKLNVFICYYLYLSVIIITMIYKLKQRLIAKTRKCMQYIIASSFLVMFLGYIYGSLSFICISFLFPVIAVLFFFHYNAFDIKTGTLDFKSLHNYIKELKNKPFGVFCLYLKNFHMENNKELSQNFIEYTERLFGEYCMFRISDEKILCVYHKKKNSSDDRFYKVVVDNFNKLYDIYKIPFKLLHFNSNKKLQDGDDYMNFCHMIFRRMGLNTFYKCTEEDIDDFIMTNEIKDILIDIFLKNDLDDDRVKAYCQPILDIKSGTYKNAEVLMRLVVDDVTYMPEKFIPIAEANGYIHTLSKIILNKTCKAINELIEEGYQFDRLSVNFSTVDFKDNDLYKEVLELINGNNTPTIKLAIEITETEDEAEYKSIRRAIKKLKDQGIVFYLDDFGSGYSNFQRTFMLPVDMIKYDRSLTTLACKNPETYSIVKKFTRMLTNVGYKVLFEGVETEDEELRCREMNPNYLQGYLYSAPIKIKELRNYFEKTN